MTKAYFSLAVTEQHVRQAVPLLNSVSQGTLILAPSIRESACREILARYPNIQIQSTKDLFSLVLDEPQAVCTVPLFLHTKKSSHEIYKALPGFDRFWNTRLEDMKGLLLHQLQSLTHPPISGLPKAHYVLVRSLSEYILYQHQRLVFRRPINTWPKLRLIGETSLEFEGFNFPKYELPENQKLNIGIFTAITQHRIENHEVILNELFDDLERILEKYKVENIYLIDHPATENYGHHKIFQSLCSVYQVGLKVYPVGTKDVTSLLSEINLGLVHDSFSTFIYLLKAGISSFLYDSGLDCEQTLSFVYGKIPSSTRYSDWERGIFCPDKYEKALREDFCLDYNCMNRWERLKLELENPFAHRLYSP